MGGKSVPQPARSGARVGATERRSSGRHGAALEWTPRSGARVGATERRSSGRSHDGQFVRAVHPSGGLLMGPHHGPRRHNLRRRVAGTEGNARCVAGTRAPIHPFSCRWLGHCSVRVTAVVQGCSRANGGRDWLSATRSCGGALAQTVVMTWLSGTRSCRGTPAQTVRRWSVIADATRAKFALAFWGQGAAGCGCRNLRLFSQRRAPAVSHENGAHGWAWGLLTWRA
jgi:hypothetical protein